MRTKQQLKDDIFNVGAELTDARERAAYLDQECGENLALKAEIKALLDHDREEDSLLDLPVPGVFHTDCPHHYRFSQEGESEAEFVGRLAGNLRELIEREGPETIAAMIKIQITKSLNCASNFFQSGTGGACCS